MEDKCPTKITARRLSHIIVQVGFGHSGGKVLGNKHHFCLQGCFEESEERTRLERGGGEQWPITLVQLADVLK